MTFRRERGLKSIENGTGIPSIRCYIYIIDFDMKKMQETPQRDYLE